MQTVDSSLLAILQSRERDLVDLYEFYPPEQTDLSPENATLRFSSTRVVWNGQTYSRKAVSRGDVSRYFSERFNSCSVTFSNVDRELAVFISGNGSLEGWRLVVRCISRSVDDDSLVLFVGRCEKAYDVDNSTVQINTKQDLGAIDNEFPWNVFAPKCPVKFKGPECLAGESLGSKSAAYQAATACNKSYSQCLAYLNTDAHQGLRFNGKQGNFKVSQRRGGAGGALLSLIGLGNHRVKKQWSAQDDAPYGKPVPFGFGRTQIELTAVVSADTGQYLAGQWIVGEGEIAELLNVRNVTSGWANSFQAYSEHLGKFGTDSSQDPLGFFASAGDKHSHRAYVEITIKGDNPDTGDAAPSIVAVVLWTKIGTWDGADFDTEGWSDKGAEVTRFLLTEARSLNYNALWVDDESFGAVVEYCDQPMLDETGGDDVYISSGSGVAGTDFKRYRSTGLLDTYHFRYLLGLDSDLPATRETTVTTFDAATPPADPTPTTRYRRRYTCNFHLAEREKVADTIFKKILPSFRGFLVTGADGKLQLRADKPMPTSYLRSSISAGGTSAAIEDAKAWIVQDLPVYYVLLGLDTATSEICPVSAINYSTAGNSVTLAVSTTGGGIALSRSGATLSGGDASTQASGTVTVGGPPANGNTATVTIDGVSVVYTLNADDTAGTVAGMLATMINADLTLNRYIEAIWSVASPTIITIQSKLGTLTISPAIYSHQAADLAMQVHMPFSHIGSNDDCYTWTGLERGNILKNTFKWPLGGKQSSYNQFVCIYTDAPQDFQETEVRENDYDHQEKVNKVNRFEIDGSCVDNYHQADRILQGARYKYRDGDFFCQWGSAGLALLLEEGDVPAVNHDSMPGRRNLPVRLEEVRISQDHRVSAIGRLYAATQYPDTSTTRTINLTTGVGWPSAEPGTVTGLDLTATEPGALRGEFAFAGFVGGQTAKIEVKKAGELDYVDTGQRVSPDADGNGAFELSGLPAGLTFVRVTPLATGSGVEGTAATDSVTVADTAMAGVWEVLTDGAGNIVFAGGDIVYIFVTH